MSQRRTLCLVVGWIHLPQSSSSGVVWVTFCNKHPHKLTFPELPFAPEITGISGFDSDNKLLISHVRSPLTFYEIPVARACKLAENVCFILTWFVLGTGGERLRKQDSALVSFQQALNFITVRSRDRIPWTFDFCFRLHGPRIKEEACQWCNYFVLKHPIY